MKRRSFISGALAACGFLLTREAEATLTLSQKLLSLKSLPKSEQLAINQATLVKPSTAYHMPKNPKHGDYVQIVIDQSSILKPSSLVSSTNVKIFSERQPLILDSLAILKLTYDKRDNDWKHT